MKFYNSVRLSGFADSCRIVSDDAGGVVARVSVVTLHPVEGVWGSAADVSSQYDRCRHIVRVEAGEADSGLLRTLSERLSQAGTDGGGTSLFPVSVSGALVSDPDDGLVVKARGGRGFHLTDKVRTVANNSVRISGEVVSLSHTDESAGVQFRSTGGVIDSILTRRNSPEGYDWIASGRLRKGDVVTMSGPLVVSEFTDGSHSFRHVRLVMHTMMRHAMEKKNPVPSL